MWSCSKYCFGHEQQQNFINQNARTVIEKYKEKLKEIKVARNAQLDQEKTDAITAKKAQEKEGRRKQFEEAHKAWTK